MKVPFTAPKTHRNNINNSLGSTNTTSNFSYEPKSVLDLRRSPSPLAGKPAEVSGFSDALLQSDDPSVQWMDHILNNSEDWDSVVKELGLNDDSTPGLKSISHLNHCDPQFTVFPHLQPQPFQNHLVPTDSVISDFCSDQNFGQSSFDLGSELPEMNNWNVGFDFVEEIIKVAECFDSEELQLGQVILARLNQQLQSPIGKPIQRSAFYFKEALNSLLTGSNRAAHLSSSSEVVQTIKAYKMFSNVSPIAMFSNFTANQAILEAVDGALIVHVIDFDIGLGGQWASFMKEIAEKANSRRENPPILRITALVPEDYAIESRLIRDNLSQFARELKIGFEIDFLLIRTFEFLSFQAFKFLEGEKIAVLLSPSIFRQIGAGFVTDLRRISPNVVVYVDGEGLIDGGTPSFRRSVINGLAFYSTVMESLEAASVGEDWIQRIETFVLRPKIFAAVEAAGRLGMAGREALAGAGLIPVVLSQFADFQADCLLRRLQVRGFHVAKRQAEMVLCWHQRPLVATSAWRS